MKTAELPCTMEGVQTRFEQLSTKLAAFDKALEILNAKKVAGAKKTKDARYYKKIGLGKYRFFSSEAYSKQAPCVFAEVNGSALTLIERPYLHSG